MKNVLFSLPKNIKNMIYGLVQLQLQLQYFIVSSQYIYETLTISNISFIQTLIRKRERKKERKKGKEKKRKEKRERKKEIHKVRKKNREKEYIHTNSY